MEGQLARGAREIGVDGNSWNPGEPIARENHRPRIAIFARDTRVDQDVLELARAPPAERPHAEPWGPKSKPHREARLQMGRLRVLATTAISDLESRLYGAFDGRDDLHVVAHDTKTPTSG